MRIFSKLTLAAAIFGALTGTASAAVSFMSPNAFDTNGYGPGESLVWNFDGVANSNFSYTGGIFSGNSSSAAEPAGDISANYGAAGPGVDSVFTVKSGSLNSLSFYLGSLDSYNNISFYSGSTFIQTFSGTDLTLPHPADGNQTAGDTNRRYFFTFGGLDDVNKVVFNSAFPAFEFDDIAASVSGVPEPATWAMMVMGFGFIGFMLRGNRRQGTSAVAA